VRDETSQGDAGDRQHNGYASCFPARGAGRPGSALAHLSAFIAVDSHPQCRLGQIVAPAARNVRQKIFHARVRFGLLAPVLVLEHFE